MITLKELLIDLIEDSVYLVTRFESMVSQGDERPHEEIMAELKETLLDEYLRDIKQRIIGGDN